MARIPEPIRKTYRLFDQIEVFEQRKHTNTKKVSYVSCNHINC